MTVVTGHVILGSNYHSYTPQEYRSRYLSLHGKAFGIPAAITGPWTSYHLNGDWIARTGGWGLGERVRTFKWSQDKHGNYRTFLGSRMLKKHKLNITPGPRILYITKSENGYELRLPHN